MQNDQRSRTIQEVTTTAGASDVISAAKVFFARRNGIYTAFLEKEGPGYASFRGQGGEELIIGTAPAGEGTRVTGSTYLFDQQIARFFSTLPSGPSVAGAGVEAVAKPDEITEPVQ